MEQIKSTGQQWLNYLEAFDYFTGDEIRPGCGPQLFLHPDSRRSLVLIHGLTDSPYFMTDLARFFHEHLGYTVFLPLLQGHGQKRIRSMRGVSLEEWKRNVLFSVYEAKQYGKVAVGGLSTGATLSLWARECCADITGPLFLYSTAMRLGDSWIDRLRQWVLTTSLVEVYNRLKPEQSLVGQHPYRYRRMDLFAARELVKLMAEVWAMYRRYGQDNPLRCPIFAAQIERDHVVSSSAVEEFFAKTCAENVFRFQEKRSAEVSHAGLVLSSDICSAGDESVILEKGNPYFSELVEAIFKAQGQMTGR